MRYLWLVSAAIWALNFVFWFVKWFEYKPITGFGVLVAAGSAFLTMAFCMTMAFCLDKAAKS